MVLEAVACKVSKPDVPGGLVVEALGVVGDDGAQPGLQLEDGATDLHTITRMSEQ